MRKATSTPGMCRPRSTSDNVVMGIPASMASCFWLIPTRWRLSRILFCIFCTNFFQNSTGFRYFGFILRNRQIFIRDFVQCKILVREIHSVIVYFAQNNRWKLVEPYN